MARMMPAYCALDAPPGESELFRALEGDPATTEWVVLHSLGLADHVRQVQGEVDFVVIVPGLGVLVIEVKSHRSLQVSDGLWRMGRDKPTDRSPFRQANEGMHSIRNYLSDKNIDTRSMPISSAAWFTHVRARGQVPASPEWHDWQLLDIGNMTGVAASIVSTLEAAKGHLAETIRSFDPKSARPSSTDTEKLVGCLRPKFELFASKGDRRRERQAQMLSFVEEQFGALDAMSGNSSVLFTGPAGSGKSFLAVEAARRELAQGRRGRLLCFNRMLAYELKVEFEHEDNIRVGSLHSEMLDICGIEPPTEADQDFWRNQLPEMTTEQLLEREPSCDFLIVDEIQDICSPEYLDVLELLVKGGLAEGRTLFFGDFQGQSIFDSEDARAVLEDRCPRMPSYRLTLNCRNLPRIGYFVNEMTRMKPGYVEHRRKDDYVDPVIEGFTDVAGQEEQFVSALANLRKEFDLEEIVVLSPYKENSLIARSVDPWISDIRSRLTSPSPRAGKINYCTVQAFKGLEAPAVILTDLGDSIADAYESLLYVGMTRATDRLVVLAEMETLKRIIGGANDRG